MKNSLNSGFKLVRSNRKSLSIEIAPETMTVRAPMNMPYDRIKNFLLQKQDWIIKKQAVMQKRCMKSYSFEEGEEILLYGNLYPVRHTDTNEFLLKFVNEEFLINVKHLEEASNILKVWYIQQAKFTFPIRVADYAKQYNLEFKQVKISNASHRWGSCSSKGSINLNWRLIRAIPEAIDYVIVHELVHTIHMDHSRTFWDKVVEIMPDYKKYRIWLKNHGHLLDFMYRD